MIEALPSLGVRMRSAMLMATLAVLWAAGWVATAFWTATSLAAASHGLGQDLLDAIARIFHLNAAPTTLIAPWFAEILLIVALGTIVVIALAMLLDRTGQSSRALRWSIRTLPCLVAWIAIAAACAWLTSLAQLAIDSGLVFLASLLLWPFIFLQAELVARDRPPLFWWPAWPGLPAVVATVVVLVACFSGEGLLNAMNHLAFPAGSPVWEQMLLSLLEWAVELALTAYVLAAWRNRWSFAQAAKGIPAKRLLLDMRLLLAFELQFIWLTMLLFAPVFCLPMLIDAASMHLLQSPESSVSADHAILARVMQFFVNYWWIGVLVVFGSLQYWWQFTAKARVLWLTNAP